MENNNSYPREHIYSVYPAPYNNEYLYENIDQYVTEWRSYKESTNFLSRGSAVEGNFSPAFQKAIGDTNVTDIYRLDDDRLMESLFESLVEEEVVKDIPVGLCSLLNPPLSVLSFSRKSRHLVVTGEIDNQRKPIWRIDNQQKSGSWTKLLRQVFNLSRMDAVATLANIVGMHYENLLQLSKDKHTAELKGTASCEDIPMQIPLSDPMQECAILKGKRYILDNAGQTIGAILLYKLEGHKFCLSATVGGGSLCLGKYKPTAHLLNQHLIDEHRFATILLCQDVRTALALQRLLDELPDSISQQVIVTAHLGSDLSVLSWNYLHGHDVVFVPAPSKQCLSMVKMYKEMCEEYANSFRVYSGFLLHSPPTCDLAEVIEGLSEGEAELLKSAIYLEDVERPSKLLSHVAQNALPYRDFKEWGRKLGVFKKRESADALPVTPQDNPFIPEPLAFSGSSESSCIKNELDTLITPENTTLLWGPSNVGKSYAALEIARVLIFGGTAFGLRSAGGKKVCYLDGEQDSTRTGKRLRQLSGGGDLLWQQKVQESFSYKALDSGATRTPEAAAMLAQTAAECGADVLVIDNIISLFPSAKNNPSKVLEFVHTVEKKGMAVIFVHHSEKTGQIFLGASELGALSKNIFKLMPVEPAEEESDAAKSARQGKGPLVRIELEKTKVLPQAEHNAVVAHLPIDGQWRVLQGGFMEDVPEAQPETQPTAESNEDITSAPKIAKLSPDARKVYEHLQQGSAKRADIEVAVGFKEDKTRDLLQELIEQGLVEKHDNGKNTYYKAVTRT